MSVLYPTLAVGRPADSPLRDKELFFEHGLRHGLPVVPAIAFFGNGALKRWHASPAHVLPEADSVLEARRRRRRQWFPAVDGRRREEGLATRRPGARRIGVLEHCARCSVLHRHVLQRRLRNHPQLQALSGKGLSTLRIVTYRSGDGTEGTLAECLRMATGQSAIDNFDAGGLIAPIDRSSGTLDQRSRRILGPVRLCVTLISVLPSRATLCLISPKLVR